MQTDLHEIGIASEVIMEPGPGAPFVAFVYTIETGAKKGKQIMMGLGFQETGYPEYPPHWVLSTEQLATGETAGKTFNDHQGRRWYGYSRNFGKVWDRCNPKNMKAFMQVAIRPFWR